jgi:hypothetical protein
MRFGLLIGAAAAVAASAAGPASVGLAGIQFGAPDYSNYLSRPGIVTCDWIYQNYFRARPAPHLPPTPDPAPTQKPSHS